MHLYRKGLLPLALLLCLMSMHGLLHAGESSAKQHMVVIKNFEFSPSQLVIKPGDTITWTNQDIAPHTATAQDKSWDTGELKKGESNTIEVTENFATAYFCLYHPMMKAQLELISGAN